LNVARGGLVWQVVIALLAMFYTGANVSEQRHAPEEGRRKRELPCISKQYTNSIDGTLRLIFLTRKTHSSVAITTKEVNMA